MSMMMMMIIIIIIIIIIIMSVKHDGSIIKIREILSFTEIFPSILYSILSDSPGTRCSLQGSELLVLRKQF